MFKLQIRIKAVKTIVPKHMNNKQELSYTNQLHFIFSYFAE